MEYLYVCKADGTNATIDLSMKDAPEIGHEITHDDGRVFERVFSAPQVSIPQAFTARGKGVTSNQLPRYWRHHKGSFDPVGKPRFETQAEINEAVARSNHNDTTTHIEHGAL